MMRSIAPQAAGAAFNAIVGLALLVLLGRLLGPEPFAHYVALLSAAAVALIPISGGNPSLLYREGVAASATATLPPLLVGRALTQVLLATALACALGAAIGGADAAAAMFCMGSIAMAELVSARLRSQGRFGCEAAWQATVRLLSAAAIVLAVLYWARSPATIFLAWSAGVLLALGLFGARTLAPPHLAGLRAHLSLTLPLVLVDALLAALAKGDVALLALRADDDTLAAYAVGTRFTDVAILAFAPVANVLMRTFKLRLQAGSGFGLAWHAAAGFAFACGAAACAAAGLGGEWLVVELFGGAYRAGGALLPWLALGLPFLLVNAVLAQAAVAAGREARLALWLGLGVLAWSAALWFAAPHGAQAAALAAATAHAALTVALLCALRTAGPR